MKSTPSCKYIVVVLSATRRLKNLQKVLQIFDYNFTAENAAEKSHVSAWNLPRNLMS